MRVCVSLKPIAVSLYFMICYGCVVQKHPVLTYIVVWGAWPTFVIKIIWIIHVVINILV